MMKNWCDQMFHEAWKDLLKPSRGFRGHLITNFPHVMVLIKINIMLATII